MSNSLTQLVPVLDGSNYPQWVDLMKAYLQQQEVWLVVEPPEGIVAPTLEEDGRNRSEVVAWNQMMMKAMGCIRLRLSTEVSNLVKDKGTPKELWNALKDFYGTTSSMGAYSFYKAATSVRIPSNEHPGPAIAKIQGNLDQLSGAGINIPMNLRALMILDAAPPRYETAIQLCLNDNELADLSTSHAREALVASWEASVTKGNRKVGEAKKLSAVKRKGKDPAFKQQQQHRNGDSQQQQQKGKGKARRGKRKGQKSSDHDHAHLASTAAISDGPTTTVDPRALLRKPVRVNGPEGESKYPTLKRAFNLARDLDITPSPERIRTLESVINVSDKGEGPSQIVEIDSHSDSADSHSSKRTRLTLAERIDWTERDDDAESTVSFGYEDDDVDMEIANAAGLYEQYDEQVRSVLLTLPYRQHADALLSAATCNSVDGSAVANLRNPVCISSEQCSHSVSFAECARCKGKSKADQNSQWMLDSGASLHFTNDMDDYIEYAPLSEDIVVHTANGVAFVKGSGTVLLNCPLPSGGHTTVRIAPVYFMPDLSIRLLSMGEFLQKGMRVSGNAEKVSILQKSGKPFLVFHPRTPNDTVYCVESLHARDAMSIFLTVCNLDYQTMHRRLGHPSKDVLRHAREHTADFPTIEFPKEEPLCRGCAEGKMPLRSFPPSVRRASRPFELIHSDLKSFPVDSYHKYKYAIMFLDDHTSYAWAVCLRSKDAALTATKHFLANVENQFKTKVQKWMSDGGGEYKSKAFDALLKDKGIEILQSVPHQPQQNGRAERLMRTLSDKAEAMRFDACLPQSWWEFAIEHAVHVYNRTPLRRLKWRTPYEVLNGEAPSIKHLRVFGCGAYVHLPPAVRTNKLSPKSELMVYIGVAPGGHGFRFMRSPNNIIFTSAHALFDEKMFPKCPTNQRRRTSRIDDPEDENPSDHEPTVPSGSDDDDEPRHPPHQPFERRQEQEHDDAPEMPPRVRTPSPPPRVPELPPTPQKPRRATRERRVPVRPGNVYGESRHPVQQFKEIEKQGEWKKIVGEQPGRSRATGKSRSESVPGSSSAPPAPSDIPAPSASGEASGSAPDNGSGHSSDEVEDALRAMHDELALAQLCREGGVGLINYLLMKAVPPVDENLPDTSNVREWTYRDIARLPPAEQKEWKAACREELEALRRRKVFELVDRPKGRKVIKNRWVFDVKSDGRKKARLVAKGFSQVEGVDYDQIFSPVVRFETVRLLLALSALEDWYITGLDVRNAYLYGKLDEEIYMEQPEGFAAKGQEHKVLRLLRALYGLKQAGLAWWRTLNESMKELGFKRLVSDAGIFVFRDEDGGMVIVIVYVDDALFCGRNKALVNKMKAKFMEKWECRDLGEVKEFLRMRIQRKGRTIRIDQCAYLEKVLLRCGMQNAKPAPTPLPAGYHPEPNNKPVDPILRSRFQTVIGSLLYIMLGTRPDIAFAVTKLSQFAANPSQEHLTKALYICRYLLGTRSYSLVYDGASGLGLCACTDSDWGSDPFTRRSQTGYFLKLAGGIFSWQSRAQKTVAHSSTEAEYMAISDCSRQVVWIRNLMSEIGYELAPIPIAGDSQGSLFMSSNPVTESRSKHIDIRYHAIREYIENKQVEVFFVDGSDNPADLFTKNLGHVKFTKFRGQLGLEF